MTNKWGVSNEHTACPTCVLQYGIFKRKVCMRCKECSRCCTCETDKKEHLSADIAVPIILGNKFGY